MSSPFDFDTPVDRAATSSVKWNRYAGRDVIPLWVADMDFRCAPAIVDALRERVDHGIFGYTDPPAELAPAIAAALERDFGWHIQTEWLVWLPSLASLKRRGYLAAAGRSAVVGVERLKNPRALMWVLGAMVLVFVGGSVLMWHWLGASTYLATLVLGTPGWLPLLMLQPWRVIRSQPAIERVYGDLRASDPGAAIFVFDRHALITHRAHRRPPRLIEPLLECRAADDDGCSRVIAA